jgi:hypothetical protein
MIDFIGQRTYPQITQIPRQEQEQQAGAGIIGQLSAGISEVSIAARAGFPKSH